LLTCLLERCWTRIRTAGCLVGYPCIFFFHLPCSRRYSAHHVWVLYILFFIFSRGGGQRKAITCFNRIWVDVKQRLPQVAVQKHRASRGSLHGYTACCIFSFS
jgi:hypothetical protein